MPDRPSPPDPAHPPNAGNPSVGLSAPVGVLGELEPPSRRSAGRLALQLLGFVIGLALLGWAVSIALSEKNRHSLEAVFTAEPRTLAVLLAVSAVSVIVNGLMFWVVLRPLHRLSAVDTALTNAIAVFLSALPMKINLVARVLIHHRRDGVPFKDIMAWFAAMAALAVAVLLPMGLAGWWRGRIDAMWWIVGVGGSFAVSGLGVWLGYLSLRHPWLSKMSLGSDRIVRHWRTVLWHTLLRLSDMGLLAARFTAAAAAAHVDLPPERTVLLATTYFFLSVLAPLGALGFREMGVAGIAIATGADAGQITLVTLIVTAAEFVASGALSLVAWVRLRPDRLWVAARKESSAASRTE